MDIYHELKKPFDVKRVHWRVGATNKEKTSCIALAYIDARDVMLRLDDVVGFDKWQCRYPMSDSGLLICDVGLYLNDAWMWKSNGAGDTQVEAEKGKCSDAFKRAAVLWGVGRYLYTLKNTWVNYDSKTRKMLTKPEMPYYATPEGYEAHMAKQQSEENK